MNSTVSADSLDMRRFVASLFLILLLVPTGANAALFGKKKPKPQKVKYGMSKEQHKKIVQKGQKMPRRVRQAQAAQRKSGNRVAVRNGRAEQTAVAAPKAQ